MRTLLLVVAGVGLAIAGAAIFAYTGFIDVSATAREPGAIHWLLETARENAVRRRAAELVVPGLSDDSRAAAGARAFDDMCAGCHGAPGRDPLVGRQDMDPPPPDLADLADDRTPAELFWVIKNGIRMTGMPAWGPTHSDYDLWELVAFVQRLPDLSDEEYRQLAAGGGNGHGHDHDHGESAASGSRDHDHDAHSQ